MPPPRRLRDVLDRLAAAEQAFVGRELLAPVLPGGQVQVRLAGVICKLKATPPDFQGWGVFRATSYTTAELVRPAGLAERQRYLELFPLLRVILCRKEGSRWLATPAHQADGRFRIRGLLPVRFVEEAELFEVCEARFDGAQCWFERLGSRRDPAAAAYLREVLGAMLPPEQVSRPGLTAEERTAYALAHAWRLEAERDRTEERLRRALAHAGADLVSYVERDDVYRVEYEVAGQRQVSVVARDDLSVQVAGICLSGEDASFDLQSLVGVLREAHDQGGVLPVGRDNRGLEEEQYWHVHPPRPG